MNMTNKTIAAAIQDGANSLAAIARAHNMSTGGTTTRKIKEICPFVMEMMVIGKAPKMTRCSSSKLIDAIKSAIPGAGFVHLRPDNSHKATFQFQGRDYEVDSSLKCVECGFGLSVDAGKAETEDSLSYSKRFKEAVA